MEGKQLVRPLCSKKPLVKRVIDKTRSLLGPQQKSEQFTYNFLAQDSEGPLGVPPFVRNGIPQATIVEERLEAYEDRNWRGHFAKQLAGRGLEIGPLHRPLEAHEKMDVHYIDRLSVSELREHYPELAELPLVEPHIIGDAETLSPVANAEYDFLVALHVIEHMKNPIGSIEHWLRVLKPGGLLYLVVPDKRAIFDKERVRTTLEHLILDYKRPSTERDYEHYLEYALHVHNIKGSDSLVEADRLIETDYSIHFHVFIPSDVIDVLEWIAENVAPLEILEGPCMAPGSDEFHFLIRKAEAPV